MARVPSIRAREVVRVAESIGFVFDRQKGSHAVYYRSSDLGLTVEDFTARL